MLAAATTVFLYFHPIRIVLAILLGEVISFLALRTLERNQRTNCFLSHHASNELKEVPLDFTPGLW
jgi:hypothetical protein